MTDKVAAMIAANLVAEAIVNYLGTGDVLLDTLSMAGERPSDLDRDEQRAVAEQVAGLLIQLEHQGEKAIRRCIKCGCSDESGCDVGTCGEERCSWIDEDPKAALCSACVTVTP